MNFTSSNEIYLTNIVDNAINLLSDYINLDKIDIYQNIDSSLNVIFDEHSLSQTVYLLFKKSINACHRNNINKIKIYVDIFEKNDNIYLTVEHNAGSSECLDILIKDNTFESFCIKNNHGDVSYKISFL